MLALPNEIGVVELLLVLCGGIAAVAVAWVARVRLERALPAPAPARRPVTVVAAASVAGALVLAPLTTWRVGHDVHYTSGLSRSVAERIGAYESYLDATLFDDVAARLPPDATYFVSVREGLPEEAARSAFGAWALTSLLPRRAVSTVGDAEWIITWGIDPRSLGAPLAEVDVLRPPKYGYPAVYLSRRA